MWLDIFANVDFLVDDIAKEKYNDAACRMTELRR
jgi:hypothetical protein